jgi:hypothetical protein
VSFVTMVPFLLLSFTNAFCRERLEHLLRLPAATAQPPIPTAAEAVEQASRQ